MTGRLSASVPSRSRNSARRRCSSGDIGQRQSVAGGDGARGLVALEPGDMPRMLAARLLSGAQDIEVLPLPKHVARANVARHLQAPAGEVCEFLLLREDALDPVAER